MTGAISTQYLWTSLQLSVSRLQSQLATAQGESTSGEFADLGLQLGAQSGQEISLQNEHGLLQTLTNDNALVTTRLDTTTQALDSLRKGAQDALQSLTISTPGAGQGAALQALGAASLQAFTSTANASVGGQYVFAGINSAVPPLTDYFAPPATAQSAIQSAFGSFLAGQSPPATPQNVTAAQLQTFLASPTFTNQFQGAAWSSNWSSASSVDISSTISPTETLQTSTNANQPAFHELAQAYAALNEFTGASINPAALQVVVTQATGLINQALASLTATEATLGSAQQRVSEANDSISAQLTILQTQIGNFDNVDPFQTATQVNSLTTQIQTAFSLTSKLQELSLVKFL